MRSPAGYNVWFDPEGPTTEMDSFQCCHCNRHMRIKPGMTPSDLGGWCMVEGKPICNNPKCNSGCTPFEKKIEWYEKGLIKELS